MRAVRRHLYRLEASRGVNQQFDEAIVALSNLPMPLVRKFIAIVRPARRPPNRLRADEVIALQRRQVLPDCHGSEAERYREIIDGRAVETLQARQDLGFCAVH